MLVALASAGYCKLDHASSSFQGCLCLMDVVAIRAFMSFYKIDQIHEIRRLDGIDRREREDKNHSISHTDNLNTSQIFRCIDCCQSSDVFGLPYGVCAGLVVQASNRGRLQAFPMCTIADKEMVVKSAHLRDRMCSRLDQI